MGEEEGTGVRWKEMLTFNHALWATIAMDTATDSSVSTCTQYKVHARTDTHMYTCTHTYTYVCTYKRRYIYIPTHSHTV